MNDSLDDILEAWNTLEPYWKITPRNGGIAPTPGYSFLRFIFSPLIRGLLRIKMSGSERIPILVIASSRRKVHYLAKDGHFKNFFLRKFMNLTGQIETQREEGGDLALASAADVLESNCALGIFPEGTRSKKTEKPLLLPGKTGVARLAASFPHANVVPVALEGTRKMMAPQAHKLPRLWKSVKINYGQKISWVEWLSSGEGGNMSSKQIRAMADLEKHDIKSRIATLYRKFTDQLMVSISELGAP